MALALLALLTALVVPTFLAPTVRAEGTSSVVARARQFAIVRGEGVRLALAANGSWRVSPANATDVTVLNGQLTAPQRALTLRISPTGLCIATDGPSWDPVRCEPREGAAR